MGVLNLIDPATSVMMNEMVIIPKGTEIASVVRVITSLSSGLTPVMNMW